MENTSFLLALKCRKRCSLISDCYKISRYRILQNLYSLIQMQDEGVCCEIVIRPSYGIISLSIPSRSVTAPSGSISFSLSFSQVQGVSDVFTTKCPS